MSYYAPNACPDDPYRVAPPYCAPGEIEPPELDDVTEDDALTRVIDTLDGKTKKAFGFTAWDWAELLQDYHCHTLEAFYLALLDTTRPSRLAYVRDESIRFITRTANEQMHAMTPEELEYEGLA